MRLFILASAVLPGVMTLPGLGAGQAPQVLPGLPVAQPSLEAAAVSVARIWEAGRPALLEELMVPTGIRFHLQEQAHASLPARKVVATLASFLNQHHGLEVAVTRVSPTGGRPPRGFAELAWQAVARGTSEPLSYTVYIGFVLRDDESWRITELRVMR